MLLDATSYHQEHGLSAVGVCAQRGWRLRNLPVTLLTQLGERAAVIDAASCVAQGRVLHLHRMLDVTPGACAGCRPATSSFPARTPMALVDTFRCRVRMLQGGR